MSNFKQFNQKICYFFMPALKTLLSNTFVPFCLHCMLSSCEEEPAKAFSSVYISRAHLFDGLLRVLDMILLS